jgi:hypothetical protein
MMHVLLISRGALLASELGGKKDKGGPAAEPDLEQHPRVLGRWQRGLHLFLWLAGAALALLGAYTIYINVTSRRTEMDWFKSASWKARS